MYCVKCGVELADSEKKCPLCGTVVFHPDIDRPEGERPFPPDAKPAETVSRSGLLFVLTAAFALPLVVTLLCDFQINGGVTWSGYSSGALLLAYIVVVLPLWFRMPKPVVFVPADFAAACVYLLYINAATGGHWFLSFALPAVGVLALIITAVVALLCYLRRGGLFVFGGAFIAIGAYNVWVEYLINRTFALHGCLIWSVYPLAVCSLFGAMLIVVGCCRPVRESLKKKFFL